MDINNKYTTEIALIELKLMIFENEYKRVNEKNYEIRNFLESIIQHNKIHIKNLIYKSYSLEIENIYKLITILEDEKSKLATDFNKINCAIYTNSDNYNLCEKLTEDLVDNIKKTTYNNYCINHHKYIINEIKKEREEELAKWKI